jgi:uncharacterized protein DUF3800
MDVCPIFIDETGVLASSTQTQPTYGIGLLLVPEPRTITDSFYKLHFNFRRERTTRRNQIRQRILQDGRVPSIDELNHLMSSSRHHEYKFSEATAHNLQQYIDLLNLCFSFPTLEFHALLIDRRDQRFSLAPWKNDTWHAYAAIIKELLRRRLKRDAFAIIDLQGKPDDASVYLEDTLCHVPHVRGCLRATSDMSIFLQLVDVLLGCVQFDWNDQQKFYDSASKRAQARRNLSAFVKVRLGMRQGDHFFSGIPPSTFRQWSKPLRFSVWRWNGPSTA